MLDFGSVLTILISTEFNVVIALNWRYRIVPRLKSVLLVSEKPLEHVFSGSNIVKGSLAEKGHDIVQVSLDYQEEWRQLDAAGLCTHDLTAVMLNEIMEADGGNEVLEPDNACSRGFSNTSNRDFKRGTIRYL